MKLTPPGGTASVKVNGQLVLTCPAGQNDCEGSFEAMKDTASLPVRIEYSAFDDSSNSDSQDRVARQLLFEIAKPGEDTLHPLEAVDFAGMHKCVPVAAMELTEVINQITQNRHSWC